VALVALKINLRCVFWAVCCFAGWAMKGGADFASREGTRVFYLDYASRNKSHNRGYFCHFDSPTDHNIAKYLSVKFNKANWRL